MLIRSGSPIKLVGGSGRLTVAVILRDRAQPSNVQLTTRQMVWKRGGGTLSKDVQFLVKKTMTDPEIIIGATVPVKRAGVLKMNTEIYFRIRMGGAAAAGESVNLKSDIQFNLREV